MGKKGRNKYRQHSGTKPNKGAVRNALTRKMIGWLLWKVYKNETIFKYTILRLCTKNTIVFKPKK